MIDFQTADSAPVVEGYPIVKPETIATTIKYEIQTYGRPPKKQEVNPSA
jgi:hypothetical protein